MKYPDKKKSYDQAIWDIAKEICEKEAYDYGKAITGTPTPNKKEIYEKLVGSRYNFSDYKALPPYVAIQMSKRQFWQVFGENETKDSLNNAVVWVDLSYMSPDMPADTDDYIGPAKIVDVRTSRTFRRDGEDTLCTLHLSLPEGSHNIPAGTHKRVIFVAEIRPIKD